MRDIASLRQARATAYDSFAAMQAAAAAENRGMTDEEQAAFDQAAASVEGLDRQIRAAERVQALQASTAIPSPAALRSAEPPEADADQGGGGGTSDQPQAYPPRHYPSARDQVEPGIRFAQCARALIVGRGNVEAAHAFAVNAWGERHEVTAALQANDASAGGFLIPERMSMEMVTLLRPRTVMRRNCHVVPLVGGTDSMPTVESGTAANYIGEGNNIGTSEPTFGLKRFTEREIAALVPISNKLLRNASQNVDFLVRDDMVGAFAQTEDLAFLRSNGVGAAPKGVRYLAYYTVAANASVTLANIDADARKLINSLANNDIPMLNVRWVMNSRVFGYLQDLRDGNSNLVFPGLQLPQPMWKGYPVEVTNNVPINLGSGSDSEVYLIDFNECVIADSFQLRIDASEAAAYKVGANLVSAFSQNQTVIRAVAGHDFGMRRVKAAAVLTAVTWGA